MSQQIRVLSSGLDFRLVQDFNLSNIVSITLDLKSVPLLQSCSAFHAQKVKLVGSAVGFLDIFLKQEKRMQLTHLHLAFDYPKELHEKVCNFLEEVASLQQLTILQLDMELARMHCDCCMKTISSLIPRVYLSHSLYLNQCVVDIDDESLRFPCTYSLTTSFISSQTGVHGSVCINPENTLRRNHLMLNFKDVSCTDLSTSYSQITNTIPSTFGLSYFAESISSLSLNNVTGITTLIPCLPKFLLHLTFENSQINLQEIASLKSSMTHLKSISFQSCRLSCPIGTKKNNKQNITINDLGLNHCAHSRFHLCFVCHKLLNFPKT
ncbi:hypothetical protein GEMRC1_004610 [Eukaryota sp. GEM-RC1]